MKNLISVTVMILDQSTSLRARITAPSIARALEIAGDGKPGRRVRVVLSAPETFFVESAPVTTIEASEPARAA